MAYFNHHLLGNHPGFEIIPVCLAGSFQVVKTTRVLRAAYQVAHRKGGSEGGATDWDVLDSLLFLELELVLKPMVGGTVLWMQLVHAIMAMIIINSKQTMNHESRVWQSLRGVGKDRQNGMPRIIK